MSMKAISAARLLASCAFVVSSGCSTTKPPPLPASSDTTQTASFWKPELLYRLNAPYPRLYVEVDAVKGCEPDDRTLDTLRKFLATYCDKPDGIQIVREPVIPKSAVRGLSVEGVAGRFMKGPPANSGATQPAFLEVLFYDSKFTGDYDSGKPGAGPHSWTEHDPYPAFIMMNKRTYPKILGGVVLTTQEAGLLEGLIMAHEAGHALGLVGRTNYAADNHCTDTNCIMYPETKADAELHIHLLLLGPRAFTISVAQTNLCARCVAELADDAKLAPLTNCYFDGAVMVRSEIGYHVLSLPNRAHVIAGKFAEQDCLDFAANAQKTPNLAASGNIHVSISDEIRHDPVKLNALLQQVASDPSEMVRSAMVTVCLSLGRYTNALDICRQSLRMDPKDDVSYNGLAWIEATCPDASVRDGRTAVANAAKACQLTGWHSGECLDTLAAAYAECGDFTNAIIYEKRALAVRSLPPATQKSRRERLSLYEESQPFRDRPSRSN